MAQHGPADAPNFKELERRGWGAKADIYDQFAGQITVGAAEPLLDAAGVGAGMRVLDVACGPGYVASSAAARGAHVIGADFAGDMVGEARRRYPGIEFREATLKTLRSARQASTPSSAPSAFSISPTLIRRLLRPSGATSGWTYAFTVWMGPDRHDFFAIVLKAIEKHGNMQCPCRRRRHLPFQRPRRMSQHADASWLCGRLRRRVGARMARAIGRGHPRFHVQEHGADSDGAGAPRLPTHSIASRGRSAMALSASRAGALTRLRGRPCSPWRASQTRRTPESRLGPKSVLQSDRNCLGMLPIRPVLCHTVDVRKSV